MSNITLIERETLNLLEWSRLCDHVSTFTATKLGVVAAQNLPIPPSKEQSLELLAQTQEIYQLESLTNGGLSFDGISDIIDSLERVAKQGILSPEELLAIAHTLAGMRKIRRVIDNFPQLITLNSLIAEVKTHPELEHDIHHAIEETAKVADRATPKLAEIRFQLKDLRQRIYQILQGILQRHSQAVYDQVITQRGDRFVIALKAPQKDVIPGIVHDISSSGATLYIEPNAIIPLGNKLRQLQRQEQQEEEYIRGILSEKVNLVKTDLEHLLAIATTLDLATAKARYSLWIQGNPPHFINSDEPTRLINLRHPLLVWQQKHEEGKEVVPVNLRINPQIKVAVITGPNTGGKTVTLKTLGLAALMAKVGLFIPAKEPVELPWFDYILADIGDEQSIEQSLSTFSGHVRRIIRILEVLDQGNSLVLLDEVGAGTDPVEGSALAIALLKYLADHTYLTIATTHFGELKALKYQDSRFENASVEFDDQTLSPTYKLLWGIPGRSNALTIAQRLGLNSDIIEVAGSLVGGQNEDINQVIAGLEHQRKLQESKAQSATLLLKETEQLYQEVSAKAKQLQENERQLKITQEQAVNQAIAEARVLVAQVIKRLQQQNIAPQEINQIQSELQAIATKYLPIPDPPKPKSGYKPKIGEKIRIPKISQTAEVITSPNSDGELTVRFGMMKMNVNLEDIESLNGEKPEIVNKPPSKPVATIKTSSPVTIRTSQNTIDLRGSRVADAESVLDRAISSTKYDSIWIIHGIGTGKLKEGVHQFLDSHPLISNYELAPSKEGGAGVTIAYLK